MAAIVIVLIKYDGRVFPSVPGDISLNAIVATLSTISKTSLIFSVSAVLGQLKWDWCEQQPRQLEDLDTFDQASRGPLGATKLLLGKAGRSVASIGAVITILALALDPFVQQVVGTAQEESYIGSEDVWVERQTKPSYFPRLYGDHDPGYLDMLNIAQPTVPPGIVDSEIITDLDPLKLKDCSAGWDREEFAQMAEKWKANGTDPEWGWKPQDIMCEIYLSGMDAIYIPITLSLESPFGMDYTNKTEAYTIDFPKSIIGWRNGMATPGEARFPIRWNSSNSRLSQVRNVLTRMGSARVSFPADTPDFRNMKLEWVETALLTLCRTTRAVTVTNGVTTSIITNQTFGEAYQDDSVRLSPPTAYGYQTPAECWSAVADGSRRSPDKSRHVLYMPGGNNVTVDPTTMNFCASFLPWGWDIMRRTTGYYRATKTIYRPQGAPADEDWLLATDLGVGRIHARLVGRPSYHTQQFAAEDTHRRIQSHTLGAVFRSVAAALNNFTLARSTEEPVRGSVRLVVTIVKVRWPWLVLPLVVEALGLVLLVVVTVFSKRRAAGLWKDSLLAVLYHGLDREDGTLHGESVRTMKDMKMMARGARVGLVSKTTIGARRIVLASK